MDSQIRKVDVEISTGNGQAEMYLQKAEDLDVGSYAPMP
jgi:hypothetical protein